MPREERKDLLRESREQIKPLISQICDQLIEKANDPIKRAMRKAESDAIITEKRLNNRIDTEIKETVTEFTCMMDEIKTEIHN